MTQGRLIPEDEAGPPQIVYLMDTGVPMWLDCLNKEPTGKCRYTPDEAKALWTGLENLARTGRLLLIGQVKDELEDKHKAAKERLVAHRRHRAPNMSRALRLRYKDITFQFKDWVRADWLREPADPWLVAYAEEFAYTVVTEEMRAADHVGGYKRRRTFIPDVCGARNVPWVSLRDLAEAERWLPSRHA